MEDKRHQALIGLAERSPIVSYTELHATLDTKSDLELEKLIISAIYNGLIDGKLDPRLQTFEISDWKASVPDEKQRDFIEDVLSTWIGHCDNLIGNLNAAAASSKEAAKQMKEDDEAHDKEVEEQRETCEPSRKTKQSARVPRLT